jgi:hypothetical protein
MIPRWPVHDPAESQNHVNKFWQLASTFPGKLCHNSLHVDTKLPQANETHAERVPELKSFLFRGCQNLENNFSFEFPRDFETKF